MTNRTHYILVELDLPAVMSRRFNKFHISRLREWKEDPARFPTRRQINRPVAEVIDREEEEWVVEGVLADRLFDNREVQYLVLWKGYPVEDATWEPAVNLTNARETVEAYEKWKEEQ